MVIDQGFSRLEKTVRTYEKTAPTLRSRDYKEPLLVASSLTRTNMENPEALPTQSRQGKTGEQVYRTRQAQQ